MFTISWFYQCQSYILCVWLRGGSGRQTVQRLQKYGETAIHRNLQTVKAFSVAKFTPRATIATTQTMSSVNSTIKPNLDTLKFVTGFFKGALSHRTETKEVLFITLTTACSAGRVQKSTAKGGDAPHVNQNCTDKVISVCRSFHLRTR